MRDISAISPLRRIAHDAVTTRRQIEAELWERWGFDPRSLRNRALSDSEIDELHPMEPTEERRHYEHRRNQP